MLVTEEEWHIRAVANVVWTSLLGFEITTEISYAGDAFDRNTWDAFRFSSDSDTINQLGEIQTIRSLQQEPLTRLGYFIHAGYRDAFDINGLSIEGFVLGNVFDDSFLWQTSVSRSIGGLTAGLILGGLSGDATSEFGGAPTNRFATVNVSYEF